MKLEQLKNIIVEENLDFYLKFYIGGISIDEDSLSIQKVGENNFNVRKTGERGMKKDYVNLSEDEACKICLDYLRNAKFLYETSNHNKEKQK